MKLKALVKKYRYIIIGIGGLFVFLMIVLVFSINSILAHKILEYQQKFETKFGYQLVLNELNVSGYDAISFNKVTILKKEQLPIVELNQVDLGLNLWSVLFSDIRLSRLKINTGKIAYHSLSNDSSLTQHDDQATEINLNKKWAKRLDRIFSALPDEFEVKSLTAEYYSVTDTFNLKINTCHLKDLELTFQAIINEYPLSITGHLNPANRQADLNFNFIADKPLPIPKKINRWNAEIFLGHSQLKIDNWDYGSSESEFNCSIGINNLGLYQSKIDKDTLLFPELNANLKGKVDERILELDSSSCVYLKKLSFNPYIKYEIRNKNKQDTIITLAWTVPVQTGQHLFDALPENGFSTIKGIQTEGEIEWHFFTEHTLSKPDSLKLFSDFTPKQLKVRQFGATDFRILNGSFTYYPYFNPRKIIIGEGAYTPYGAISPVLIQSVLNAEDGGFFYHKGFNQTSILESAIEDLKLGYFRRGGSTITMQLVKNIFLGHQKTITRKLEEMLIVWLIENLHLSSKQRMVEVYLNAIEWGPNIYGITEASNFYFYKHPSQLSLEESIFLAMIIPHPRAYGIHFDPKTGSLSDINFAFFQLIAKKLLAQKLITIDQLNGLNMEDVILSINARKSLRLDSGVERYTKKEGHTKLMQVIREQKREDDLPEIPDELKDK